MKKIFVIGVCLCVLIGIYVVFNLFYLGENKKKNRKSIFFDFATCLLLSIVASLQFNSFLSEFYADSSVFAYMGKMMHEGLLPYKDLFDHKGIILYFIQYIAGFFDNIFVGLWVIEVINLFIFAYFTLKTIKLFTENKLTQFTTLAIICCLCTLTTFEGGNLVEEYALPWLSISMFLFYKWFKTEELKIAELLCIGGSFSVVLFLRPNMIALWVSLIPIVAFTIIAQKRWNDLLKCICWFCAGVAIVLLALGAYFICTDTLKDMIETYFIFNFGYTSTQSGVMAITKAMMKLALYVITLIPSVLLTFIPEIKKKNKIYFYNLVFAVISLIMAAMSGRTYSHYAIVLLPVLVLPLLLMLENIFEIVKQRISLQKKNSLIVQSLCIVLSLAALLGSSFIITHINAPSKSVDTISVFLQENTTEEDDVLFLGNSCKRYLTCNRTTNNKYFYQNPPINISDSIYEDFMIEIKNKEADYVVCFGDRAANSNIENNMGSVYRYYEKLCASNEYICCEFEGFYIYKKGERN